jgi:SAM-dependent methyltransferase
VLQSWKIKGIIQKSLSGLPGGECINDSLQRRLGGLTNFDANVRSKVEDWALLISYLRTAGADDFEREQVMEIGSGWYPTLPICFHLAGVKHCHTVDISRHMKPNLALRMLTAIEKQLSMIGAVSGRGGDAVRAQYEYLRQATGLDDLLARAGIVYHAPADASNAYWFADEAVDLVYSNSVLEHVPEPVIMALMKEAHRVLKPEGLMVHAVGCNDHYAFFDKSISFVNYLQFTEKQWRLWNNRLLYQNRLRANDFIRLARESGFEVVHEARAVRPGSREALASLRIADEFRSYATEDIVATTVDFVARKKKRGL